MFDNALQILNIGQKTPEEPRDKMSNHPVEALKAPDGSVLYFTGQWGDRFFWFPKQDGTYKAYISSSWILGALASNEFTEYLADRFKHHQDVHMVALQNKIMRGEL